MATVTFVWHLHQPAYRTADGVAHAPWAALHAGGSYMTLSRAILESGGRGQVINIVPTLLEQLEAYRDGTVTDPVMRAIVHPATELGSEDRATLVEWAFHVTSRQLERYPRLRELASRRDATRSGERLASLFGPGDLRDLQVLVVLAHAGEQGWRDQRLAHLADRGRHFSVEDQRAAAQWLLDQPRELIDVWKALAAADGIEISTSPFAHPIMPLLVDTQVVEESWAPGPAPQVPTFRHPEDARWHLDEGLRFMRERGFDPQGCWPPEGSVSAAALTIYDQAGVRWLVTDEGILERSLGRPLRSGDRTMHELYAPWRLESPGPMVFFRDRWLSDRVGFVYGHWDNEARAAGDMVSHLTGLARKLPDEAAIVVALDGENPWLHYPEGGGTFLRELLERLNDGGSNLRPATCAELCDRLQPQVLPRLHPGSWINSVFATWIGHPEKTRAWRVLTAVREELAGNPELPPSLLLAEGSDWFWWLGDDNPTQLAPLYDRIFRHHLADSCIQAGITPPVDLEQPLKAVTHPLRVPVSNRWPAPELDGRITSYFEWSLASWVRAEASQPLQRLAVWGGQGQLHILVEGAQAMQHMVSGTPLIVRLQSPEGVDRVATVSNSGIEDDAVAAALARVAELSLPWDGREGYRLEVRLGACRLPDGGVLLLEPLVVDEER